MSATTDAGAHAITEPQRTPLYDEHIALGARMVEFAGYEMPLQYTSLIEEHNATRTSAGLFDVSHMAQFRISGEGAYAFLQRLLTNDLARIADVGAAQYTLMLDDEGGILDDLIVYHTGAEYMIIANAANRVIDLAWLRNHAPDDVEIVDESDRTALLALQGPEALRILSELIGEEFEPPARFHLVAAMLDERIPALVARTGYTGEDGVELIVRADDAATLWRALLSFPEVTPVGLGARDTLRLEMGYPLYGTDMDETRNPIEAGLGWVCPADKTGYIGAEAVARARAETVEERLVHLKVEGGIPRQGSIVRANDVTDGAGTEIGRVLSGSHSPTYGFGMATAYLPTRFAEPDTEVTVDIRKKSVTGVVVKPPYTR
ncbi:MAG: glycine cleavage system aminomethyltransferase GcvT [Coriobacteriia bacterium]|nr:glycine cleavage system aminomethyltransferase GcvT [Coriobacteriia bacterium]